MNLHHLAVFHAVAREQSVTRGAQRLKTSQPAVSRQLAELERALQARLVDRLPRGVGLTPAGELLYGYAQKIFALEAEARRAIGELQGLQRGRLLIGASLTVGSYLLPAILARFRAAHPGLEVAVEIANTREVLAQLARRRLDLGLTEGFVPGQEFRWEVFGGDELVGIGPPGHPLAQAGRVTAARLCAQPVILREEGSGTRAVIERALVAKGLRIQPVMTLGSTEAIKAAVACGAGLAIVSQLSVRVELDQGRLALIHLSDLRIHRDLHLSRLADRTPGRAAQAFMRMLKTEGISGQTGRR